MNNSIISRKHFLIMLTLVIALGISGFDANAETAKIKPGTWVLYECNKVDQRGKASEYTLKYLILSEEKGQYWIEIATRQGENKKIYKFLAPLKEQKSYLDRLEFWGTPTKLIIQHGKSGPQEVPAQSINRYMPVVIEVPKRSSAKAVSKPKPDVKKLSKEMITVGKKSYQCTHNKEEAKEISEVNLGFINIEDTNILNIEIWEHVGTPITGIVRAKAEGTLISKNKNDKSGRQPTPRTATTSMMVKKFGKSGATSEITGTPKMMEPISFPFLQLKQQTPTKKKSDK